MGTYTWVASYSGDSPNTNAVPASACPDTTGTETVVVSDTGTDATLPLADGTNAGLALTDKPVFSVQHHPEASPGPTDSLYLFERFAGLEGEILELRVFGQFD